MTRYQRLKLEARAAALYHGHVMTCYRTRPSGRPGGQAAEATCRACGAYVQVNTAPLPNETFLAGTAVALTCNPLEDMTCPPIVSP